MNNTQVDRRVTPYAILMVVMAILGQVCLAGDFYGYAAVIPLVADSLNMNDFQSGLVQGIFGLSFAIALFVWSPMAKRWSSRSMLCGGLLVIGLLMIIQGYARNFHELLLLRVIVGFIDGLVFVGCLKIVMEWLPRRLHGFGIGLILAAYSLAITLDFAIGLSYAQQTSWRAFFIALGYLTLVVAILSLFVKEGPTQEEAPETEKGNALLIFKEKWVWISMIAIFGDLFSVGLTASWLIPNFIEVYHLDPQYAPTIGLIMGLSQVGFLIIGGYLSDKLGENLLLIVGATLTGLSALAALVANFSGSESLLLMITIAIVCGVGVFSGGAIFSFLVKHYGVRLAPVASGYAEMGGVLGTFTAPAVAGYILDLGNGTVDRAVAYGNVHIFFIAIQVAVLLSLVYLLKFKRVSTTNPRLATNK